MSTVSEVVTVVIEIKDAAVSQTGFGVPLIAAYHNFWPERVRTFEEAGDLLLAPYSVPPTHPIYLIARALKSQQPSPDTFMVGKRLGAAEQTIQLRLASTDDLGVTTEGALVGLTIEGAVFSVAGGLIEASRDLLVTAINASPLAFAAVAGVGDEAIVLTANTGGARLALSALVGVTAVETTADPAIGIATDLAAIRAANDGWYGLLLDTSGPAEVQAAAAWAETEAVLLFVTLGRPLISGGEGPTLSSLGAYNRTVALVHEKPHQQQAAAAWAGRMLPKQPGSATWANKSLAGVDKSQFDAAKRAELTTYNYNYYVDVKGVGFTLHGVAGSGRFIDITSGMDWFDIRTQERIVGLFANSDKIPYTDKGTELIRAQIVAQVLEGISAGIIDGDSPWSVTVPLVAAIAPADKIARTLPRAKFNFVLQGAVHKVAIEGTVLVAL